jgi:hypothetical protein
LLRMILNKELTSYAFSSELTHGAFVSVLEQIAHALKAQCFVATTESDRWRQLGSSDLVRHEVLSDAPQVVGWREGTMAAGTMLNLASIRLRSWPVPSWESRMGIAFRTLLLSSLLTPTSPTARPLGFHWPL